MTLTVGTVLIFRLDQPALVFLKLREKIPPESFEGVLLEESQVDQLLDDSKEPSSGSVWPAGLSRASDCLLASYMADKYSRLLMAWECHYKETLVRASGNGSRASDRVYMCIQRQ